MDKNTFMRELEHALSVLQEDEIRDILSEYEQHIDMKVKSGLSEEEAIADFGSLSELTADILSAYHVRADYAADERKAENKKVFYRKALNKKTPEEKTVTVKRLGDAAESLKNSCGKAGGAAIHGLKELGVWLWSVVLFWKRQLVRPFAWAVGKWKGQKAGMAGRQAETELLQGQPERKRRGEPSWFSAGIRQAFRSMGSGIGFCMKSVICACLWGIRMCWNIGWCLFSLLFGCIGLVLLFLFGIGAVLLIQGYPLAGVLIACLGAMLCTFSAAWLGITFLWRKKAVSECGQVNGRTYGEADVHMKEDGEQYA